MSVQKVKTVGILHPGAMGESVAVALADNGHRVVWCRLGRSAETAQRAEAAGARACASLSDLCDLADVIISVCPPESAMELAAGVVREGFLGLYADVNAISPETSAAIGQLFPSCYVDGGIIGPPAARRGTTRLYLSGARADEIFGLFEGSLLEPQLLTEGDYASSGLKMSYAAWTKGSAALLLNSRALAESLGVGKALEAEWSRSQPGTLERAETTAAGVGPKAWRFEGEMREIAATFRAARLPDDFHLGAADVYHRLAPLKGKSKVELAATLRALSSPDAKKTRR